MALLIGFALAAMPGIALLPFGANAASAASVASAASDAGDADLASGAAASAEPVPIFLTYTAGFDFTRGDYGLEDDSTLYYVPLGLIVDYDRLRFRVTLPLLYSDGPTAVSITGGTTASSRAGGLGEILTAVSWLFEPIHAALPYAEFGLQVTWPTRTRRELGAGSFVFEPRLDFFRQWGAFTPFATVGRSFYTDALDDRFFASLGFSLELTERVALGAAYDWFEDPSRSTRGDTPDASEIVPFLVVRASDRWSLSPYAIFGLSDGSPDYGFGFSVNFAP